MTHVTRLGFALLLGLPGCSKGSAYERSASSPPSEAYDGEATVYDFSDEAVPEIAMAAPSDAAVDADFAPEEPQPITVAQGEIAAPRRAEAPKKTSSTAPDTGEPAVAKPDPEQDSRYIVYTAAMTIAVFDLAEALAIAERFPDTFGGYLSSLSGGAVILRVPAAKLRPAMDALAELGNVEQRSLTAQEVTAEFVDIESRIRALTETHAQLLTLLSQARNVEEALEVRAALDRINGELEVLKGRMRHLSNLIAFSTLHITFIERGPHDIVPTSNDPFPWVDRLGVEATEWR